MKKLTTFKDKTKKKKILRYGIFSLILIIFLVVIVLAAGKGKKETKKSPAPSVCVAKPEKGDLDQSLTISGYVEAKAMIPVVPFVSGTITEYNARAGDFVKKDTVLAKIDDAPFRQQMLQAQAAYFAAKSTFDRIESLYKSGSTTRQNYDSVKAQHDASKAQYDLAKLQLDYTQVKAPVDGTILIADQATGSIGNQTTPVAVLADLTNLVVRLKVPEKYFDLFTMEKENLQVKVIRPGLKGMYEDAVTSATIENIAPYVSPQTKNFELVCHLDNPGERFRPGMFIKVQVTYKHYSQVLLLPVETRKMDGSVYTFDPETKTVHFLIPENIAEDGKNFIIPSEYENTYFVTDGQNFIFDGQAVNLMEDVLETF